VPADGVALRSAPSPGRSTSTRTLTIDCRGNRRLNTSRQSDQVRQPDLLDLVDLKPNSKPNKSVPRRGWSSQSVQQSHPAALLSSQNATIRYRCGRAATPSIVLLIRRFRVRIPGGAPQNPSTRRGFVQGPKIPQELEPYTIPNTTLRSTGVGPVRERQPGCGKCACRWGVTP
jgi:hypothetical protein